MTKNSEQFYLVITRYRDKNGLPTCAINFETGDICIFYRTQRVGVNETCVFTEDYGHYQEKLTRRDGGEGSLIPLKQCPIWERERISHD